MHEKRVRGEVAGERGGCDGSFFRKWASLFLSPDLGFREKYPSSLQA